VSATDRDPQDSPNRGCPGKGSRAALIYGGEPLFEEEEAHAGDGDIDDDAIAYGTCDREPPAPVGFREDVDSLLGIDLDAYRRRG
jgi:hypothetical protein